jgi:hypothetical protein
MFKKDINFNILIAAILVLFIVFLIGVFIDRTTNVDIHEYTLEEVEDGVYGYYYNTRSRAPAYNYEVIVLCIDGQVYNMAGHVNIHYTDNNYRCIHTDTNQVYNDTFDVYIPKGSLEMMPDVMMA